MPSPIDLLQISSPIVPVKPPKLAGDGPASGGEFRSVLTEAIHKVEQYRTDADQSVERFLSGQGEELHNVALATQRAELSFELFLQMRNKVVEAYQEVMRMQV